MDIINVAQYTLYCFIPKRIYNSTDKIYPYVFCLTEMQYFHCIIYKNRNILYSMDPVKLFCLLLSELIYFVFQWFFAHNKWFQNVELFIFCFKIMCYVMLESSIKLKIPSFLLWIKTGHGIYYITLKNENIYFVQC